MKRLIPFAPYLSIGLVMLITALSLIPLPKLPDVPGTDKSHHFIAYGSAAIPVSLARVRHLWIYLPAFALWSGIIELIQPFVNRHADWFDLLANCCGLLIGWLLATMIRMLFMAIQQRIPS